MTFRKIRAAGDDGSGVTSQDLLQSLGKELFDKLRDQFGGREIKVPKFPADDHPIVKALGREDADFFCEEFEDIQIYIPKSGNRFNSREEFIRRAIQEGISRADIAKALDISTRHLRRIMARMGISGVTAVKTGKTIEDIASSLSRGRNDQVDLGPDFKSRFAVNCIGSAHGGARRCLTLSVAEQTDRQIGNLTPSVIRQRERIFMRYLERAFTKAHATMLAGVSPAEFSRLLERYQKTGTIVPPSMLAAASQDMSRAGQASPSIVADAHAFA